MMVVSIGFCGRGGYLEVCISWNSHRNSHRVHPLCPQETEAWWISFLWWIPFAKHHKYRLTTTIKAYMHAKCAAMLLSCLVFLHGFVLKYGTPQSTGWSSLSFYSKNSAFGVSPICTVVAIHDHGVDSCKNFQDTHGVDPLIISQSLYIPMLSKHTPLKSL